MTVIEEAERATQIILPGEPKQEMTADRFVRWLNVCPNEDPFDEAGRTVDALCVVIRKLTASLAASQEEQARLRQYAQHKPECANRRHGVCVCGHHASEHEEMGLSENLIVLPRCRKCACAGFDKGCTCGLDALTARAGEGQ